jgi:hypothetical protein
MINTKTARTWIGDELTSAGLRRHGAVWRLQGADVQWVVHIDRLPFGHRLGVDIGLDLRADSAAGRPTDCPILLHLENVSAIQDVPVVAALDLDSGLDDDERRRELGAAVRAVAFYLREHLTLSSVREAYVRGDFTSAFIHKDARTVLEGGEEP